MSTNAPNTEHAIISTLLIYFNRQITRTSCALHILNWTTERISIDTGHRCTFFCDITMKLTTMSHSGRVNALGINCRMVALAHGPLY